MLLIRIDEDVMPIPCGCRGGEAAVKALLQEAGGATAGGADPGAHVSVAQRADAGDDGEVGAEQEEDTLMTDSLDGEDALMTGSRDGEGAADEGWGQAAAGADADVLDGAPDGAGAGDGAAAPAAADSDATASGAAAATVAPNLVSRDDVRQGHAAQGAAPSVRSEATLRWCAFAF